MSRRRERELQWEAAMTIAARFFAVLGASAKKQAFPSLYEGLRHCFQLS
jgi:hypothetical protein